MSPNRLSAVLVTSALALQPVFAAAQAAAPPAEPSGTAPPTFGVGTAAVTLDVVVRDKKGKAVRDLTAADFEVFEDGVKQTIDTFEVFGRPLEEASTPAPAAAPVAAATSATAPATAAPDAPADPTTRPQVIAFVFDRLSAEARDTARKAALTYVEGGHVEGDIVGIFAIDLALRTILPFSRDLEEIRVGLERAASQGNTAFDNVREKRREMVDQFMAGQRAAEGIAGANPGQGASGSDLGRAAGAAAFTQAVAGIQASMLRNFETLERDQQGYASSNGLLAVVSGLKSLPGRKTVVFFSEGLTVTSNVQAQFLSVIANANRSNVSVYAMDAGGLRAHSMNQETRDEMRQAQDRRLRELESGHDSGDSGPGMRSLERNEDLLRLNPEAGLGQLANETGGFLIRDTNDAGAAFRRIEEDMRFHYLVAYSPTNEDYDGRFRTISLKVKRPGVQVQTRQGYFAVRAAETTPLRGYEAPALVRLDRQPRPHDFPIQAAALSFPTAERPGLAPVLVRVPAPAYELDKTDKSGKKIHRADLTVLARVKDPSGREVDRVSQHYPLSAPADLLEKARRGDILFYREAELPPGRYTVEAIAYDAVANKSSVSTAAVEVPAAEGPRLSSIVLIGRAEKVAAGEQTDNPLYYGDTILYPNMGEPFRKSVNPALGFFFSVYGAKTPTPKATIEVYRGDQRAGQVTADLPAPDATGRIQYAGSLPLQGFAAGSYTLKVTTTGQTGSESRQASFTVAE